VRANRSGLRSCWRPRRVPTRPRVRASCALPCLAQPTGLVANVSLIMGVAGASSGDAHTVVLAGIAGLMAGSFSMAVGEYISGPFTARAPRLPGRASAPAAPSYARPGTGHPVEIYESRGLSRADASFIVGRLLAKPKRALDTFVRDEIGLSAKTMGSPIAAAVGSLLAFALGASVPLAPFLLLSGAAAFALTIAATLAALFLVGLGVSRLTHRQPVRSGLRQAALGLLASRCDLWDGALLGDRGFTD